MTSWVAISNGALDIKEWHENQTQVELMLLSVYPSEPIGLEREPAELWRRLVGGPIDDAELTDGEQVLVREFAEAGLASDVIDHPARVVELKAPWLVSPVHELVYALVASVAKARDVKAVFIKGPILQRQDLRSRKHSGDVDVWVDPEKINELVGALLEWEWIKWPDIWDGTEVNHSITLEPGVWGCEIDLHRHMPGCDLSDIELFERVRTELREMTFAGVSVSVPNRATHAVICSLHLLRPHREEAMTATAIESAAQVLAVGGQDTFTLAEELRALAALEPAILRVFPERSLSIDYSVPVNWKWRMHRSRIRGYAQALRLVPTLRRPQMLLRLFWPPQAVVDATNARAGSPHKKGMRGRLFRWGRALGRRA